MSNLGGVPRNGAFRLRTVARVPATRGCLQTDLRNVGAQSVDQELGVDREGLGPPITGRKPDDLPAFCGAVLEHSTAATRSAAAR